MKDKSASKSLLIGVFVVLVLAASNSIVRAQGCPSTSWIGGPGDWFTSGNWSGCVPNITTNAYINNGGEARNLGNSDHAATQSLTVGDNSGDSGAVTIDSDSASLDVTDGLCWNDLYLGNHGKGNMTISNGGQVTNRAAYVARLANFNQSPSSGYVLLKNAGNSREAQWIFTESPGCPGAGLFIGCTASSDNGGTGLVQVDFGGRIVVSTSADAPSVKVGLSGTLTGTGVVQALNNTYPSETVQVLGTLAAPASGAFAIAGNLELRPSATTTFSVTPHFTDQ